MDKTIQIYEPGSVRTANGWQPGMADDVIRRNIEPCYVTHAGETFYIGNEGKLAAKKHHISIFSRIFRRRTVKKERISVWKKSIA